MSELLHLEYACTPEELRAAQNLIATRQLGGGSKWRAYAVVLGLLAVMGAAFWQQITSYAPGNRPYAAAGFGVIMVAAYLYLRRQQRAQKQETVTALVSEAEIRFAGKHGESAMAWSAFSQCLESPEVFVLVNRTTSVMYVVPKRAFADEAARDWFRGLTAVRVGASLLTVPPAEPWEDLAAADAGVKLEYRLGLRDFWGLVWASWFTRTLIVAAGLLMPTVAILTSLGPPPPGAVHSSTTVFLCFALPAGAVMFVGGWLLLGLYTWFRHLAYITLQEVTVAEPGMSVVSRDGAHTFPWEQIGRYKETRRSFIVWTPGTRFWLLLPKRRFASRREVERCRELLGRHVRRSTWFLGP